MEIKWVRTFIIAATYENFRKTSEELYLTQPAITKHIKNLEDSLMVKLFERNGKTVTLTSAGHHFLPYAKEIVSAYENGLGNFEAWKQGYQRKLVIASAPQIASSLLPVILSRFIREHPNIEVIINIVKSYEIAECIRSGLADLGLSRIKPSHENVFCRKIHEDRVVLVAPPDSSGDEEQTLTKYRVMTNNHPEYWDNLIKEIKSHYPFVRTMNVGQLEITKRFIESGLGVSYLPYTMVKTELQTKRLREVISEKIVEPTSSTYTIKKVDTQEANAFLQVLYEEIHTID
ncbi:LysR family transcriptional regulator [Metabacillus malikii]|uniref:LysR family transcriptional repressor of citA n=1 Tax=Metabacillus malikii TaxID=1504265 RepID=A0ABT9ZAS4_9BACI|nr:LysR family transcriptional regulator [Metabacillus malikii]MDQ0229347.1 LysR family transcriptional repressor of citA [Metabacillus malikii]